MNFWRYCQWHANHCTTPTALRKQVGHISEILYGSYRDAVYPACFYFSLTDLWESSSAFGGSESHDVVVNLAHTLADVVPIQLFNFRKLLASAEARLVLDKEHQSLLETFDKSFPRISHARNAVAHGHDRSLGQSYNPRTKKKQKFAQDYNPERLTRDGKYYVDADGKEFCVSFSVEQLSEYWRNFARALERICA